MLQTAPNTRCGLKTAADFGKYGKRPKPAFFDATKMREVRHAETTDLDRAAVSRVLRTPDSRGGGLLCLYPNPKMCEEIMNLAEKKNTKFVGLVPDMGIFQYRIGTPNFAYAVRHGANPDALRMV